MVCQVNLSWIRKNPWIVLHLACFLAFIVQMSILASNQIHPSDTVSRVVERKLNSIEFPVLFKICVKPAFDIKKLEEVGYENIWKYFLGRSKYNSSLFGWGGHTVDGNTIGSVTGTIRGWLF